MNKKIVIWYMLFLLNAIPSWSMEHEQSFATIEQEEEEQTFSQVQHTSQKRGAPAPQNPRRQKKARKEPEEEEQQTHRANAQVEQMYVFPYAVFDQDLILGIFFPFLGGKPIDESELSATWQETLENYLKHLKKIAYKCRNLKLASKKWHQIYSYYFNYIKSKYKQQLQDKYFEARGYKLYPKGEDWPFSTILNEEISKQLYQATTNYGQPDAHSPLLHDLIDYASSKGNTEDSDTKSILQLLSLYQIGINALDEQARTPLMKIMKTYHYFDSLFPYAYTNYTKMYRDPDGITFLMICLSTFYSFSTKQLEFLIRSTDNHDATDNEGFTALTHCLQGTEDDALIDQEGIEKIHSILACLISYGASLNIPNVKGENALIATSQFINIPISIVKLLLDNKVNINALTIQNKSALWYILYNFALFPDSKKYPKEVVEMLLPNNLTLNLFDRDCNLSPLMIACMSPHYQELCELLLKAGAKINSLNNNRMNVLMFICSRESQDHNPDFIKNNRDQMVRFLLSKGANLNQQDNDGNTALSLIAQNYVKTFELVPFSQANTEDHQERKTLFSTLCLLARNPACKKNLINYEGKNIDAILAPMGITLDSIS